MVKPQITWFINVCNLPGFFLFLFLLLLVVVAAVVVDRTSGPSTRDTCPPASRSPAFFLALRNGWKLVQGFKNGSCWRIIPFVFRNLSERIGLYSCILNVVQWVGETKYCDYVANGGLGSWQNSAEFLDHSVRSFRWGVAYHLGLGFRRWLTGLGPKFAIAKQGLLTRIIDDMCFYSRVVDNKL